MSWKKHFTTYNTGQNSPLTKQNNLDRDNTTKFQSWLPEVYDGSPDRISRYSQYDHMDADSEINIALDTIAEFSTQENEETVLPFKIEWHNTPTETESDVLNTVLKQWCRVNQWNQRIFTTFRNTIKYGDQPFIRDPETWKLYFVSPFDLMRVVVDEANGKEPAQYIIKNLDPNFQTMSVSGNVPSYMGGATPEQINSGKIAQAYNRPNGSSGLGGDTEFMVDANHVIHVSLTDGMHSSWPFGNSILDAVFKTYKQKELLEDSIIIYRVQRAPERRIFYIDVGDMPTHQAMSHVERIKNEIHQRRIPSKTGGGANMMDANYNPMSMLEDYFFAQTADGRGSKVDTLPGGENVGEIDDLKFFNNKLARGLRIPSSYLPTGPDDGTATYNDGRVGTAHIQEYKFTQYCRRLQRMIIDTLDKEFKMFMKHRGYGIDVSQFYIDFVEPQSFSDYRDIEINSARASLFGSIEGVEYISRRFALKKYLQLSDSEILENEKLYREENPIAVDGTSTTDDMGLSGMSDMGMGSGDIADFEMDDDDIDVGDDVDLDAGESPIDGQENLENEQ